MEALVRARPYALTAFFLALAVIIGAGLTGQGQFQKGAGVAAYLALFVFLLTESFGSLSRRRSKFSRGMARAFLVLSFLAVASSATNLMILSIDP